MADERLSEIMKAAPEAQTLWAGKHKIPWDDPAFSQRMLNEHLSQDHDLASRKQQTIVRQAEWIHEHFLGGGPSSILDLGCGPGLYARLLAGDRHQYHGIDFGPASIDYAKRESTGDGRCEFTLGDVVTTDFGGPYDLAVMLYGEVNVFPPQNCARILAKVFDALSPGGHVLLEAHTYDAVKRIGTGENTWYKARSGLFSQAPHLCLVENHWFDDEGVAQQLFHVVETATARVITYKSTTKAWTNDEYYGLLGEAGFSGFANHLDWPRQGNSLLLISAQKK